MSLAGKVVIVTGGGSGIGATSARLFASEGAHVVVTGRRKANLDAVVREIKAAGKGDALAVQADVTNDADWYKIKAETLSKFGRVDFLLNNAGFEGSGEALAGCSDKDLVSIFAINNVGPLLGVKHFADELAKTKGGVAIISSVAGLITKFSMPSDGFSPYAMTKSAAEGFVRSLHLPLLQRGVRIFGINPAVYSSEMVDKITASEVTRVIGVTSPAAFAFGFNPLGNLGNPIDVAKVILATINGTSKLGSGDGFAVMPSPTEGEPIVVATNYFNQHLSDNVSLTALYADAPLLDFKGEPVPAEKAASLKAAITKHQQTVAEAMAAAQKK
jgi:NAD(P)-dependent dehydrogenase (short-subunit alcohol dehydrogenase family)